MSYVIRQYDTYRRPIRPEHVSSGKAHVTIINPLQSKLLVASQRSRAATMRRKWLDEEYNPIIPFRKAHFAYFSILGNASKVTLPSGVIVVQADDDVSMQIRAVASSIGLTYLGTIADLFRDRSARPSLKDVEKFGPDRLGRVQTKRYDWHLYRNLGCWPDDWYTYRTGTVLRYFMTTSSEVSNSLVDMSTLGTIKRQQETIDPESIQLPPLYAYSINARDAVSGIVSGESNPDNHNYPIDAARYILASIRPPVERPLVLDMFARTGDFGCAATIENYRYIGFEPNRRWATIADERIRYWSGIRNRILPIHRVRSSDSDYEFKNLGNVLPRPARYRADQIDLVEKTGATFNATIYRALDFFLGTRSSSLQTIPSGLYVPAGILAGDKTYRIRPDPWVMRKPHLRPDQCATVIELSRKGYFEQDIFRIVFDTWVGLYPSPEMPSRDMIERMRAKARSIAFSMEQSVYVEDMLPSHPFER